MKKISIFSAICLISLAHIASAQVHTQFLTFNDNNGTGNAGTYSSTDTFSLDIFLTFAGYNSPGLSLWFETTASAAPFMSVTGFTYGTTFSDPIQGDLITFPVGFTLAESNNMFTTPNPSDFGALVPINGPDFTPVGPGTYFVGHLSINLNGLAPGIYALQSDAFGPHASEVTSFDGTTVADNNLPVSTYTITIVPEPGTFALLILAAISGGILIWRRTVSKQSRINQ